MSATDQFARLSKLSLERHGIAIEVDWRYEMLFDFLQVSPSYSLAHMIATGQKRRDLPPLPQDFELVEQTYRMFGNVLRTYFYEWWLKIAQFQFGSAVTPRTEVLFKIGRREELPLSAGLVIAERIEGHFDRAWREQGQPATLLLALPVHGDRRRLLRELTAILDAEYVNVGSHETEAPARLVSNKIRERTVRTAMRVLRARISVPTKKLYQVGNSLKLAPQYWTDAETPRKGDQDGKRRLMEIVTSRQLHRAYLLAENAARGRFPSLEPLSDDPARPQFDFKALNKQIWDYIKWGREHVAQVKEANERARQARARAQKLDE